MVIKVGTAAAPAEEPMSFLQQFIGWSAVLGSALCFYLATAIIRWADSYVEITTPYFVFSRFLLGFIVVCLTLSVTGHRLRPKRYHFLLGRTVANSVAVYCFYKAVDVGTLAEANILNMTYPLFVALFAWLFVKKQRDYFSLFIVAAASAGIWMILSPGGFSLNLNNLWGLSSGVMAAAAMIYLNVSRRYHDSQTILFYMFGLGALVMFALFRTSIYWPDRLEFVFLFACSAAGVLGQYLLTYGFLYVTAVEGSIISSSRIVLAALLGPVLVGDPALTVSGWFGALIIFLANSSLAVRRSRARRV